MKTVNLSATSLSDKGCCIALGMFDGVHIGHRRIVSAAKSKSAVLGCATAVLLFSSSPHGAENIMTLDGKLNAFKQLGVDYAFVYDFAEIKDLTPKQFAEDILVGTHGASAVFAGFNYHFGKYAAGDADMLVKLCEEHGIFCGISECESVFGEAVSSSRIRRLISEGRVKEANTLLFSPYSLTGEVRHGKMLGRQIGFPTVNLNFASGSVIPASGVYCTKTEIFGREYISISNAGVRPTVENSENVNLETYIMDFDGDLYGKTVTVHFYDFIRPEKKFSGVEELMRAIEKDTLYARNFFLNGGERY